MRPLPILCVAILIALGAVRGSAQVPDRGIAEPPHRSRMRLPCQGLEVIVEKVIDPRTGEVTTRATTAAGVPVDVAAALAVEAALAKEPQSKITPLLRERLAGAAGAPIQVNVWLGFDPKDVDFRADLDIAIKNGVPVAQAKQELRARVRNGNRNALEPG